MIGQNNILLVDLVKEEIMRRKFDIELEVLNNELIQMGSLVEWSIENAVAALIKKDIELAKEVIDSDGKINDMERQIENRCLNLLLMQQPVAGDLRTISSILKIITDLERIGDHAQDISEITVKLGKEEYIKEIIDIKEMLEIVIKMVNMSIDAFINKDEQIALKVIKLDYRVNELFDIIKLDLINLIQKDKNNGEQALNLLMIAKYLERIGDHAQNIGEWILFLIKGEHLE